MTTHGMASSNLPRKHERTDPSAAQCMGFSKFNIKKKAKEMKLRIHVMKSAVISELPPGGGFVLRRGGRPYPRTIFFFSKYSITIEKIHLKIIMFQ